MNAFIFKERINIERNKEFKEILEFLIDINEPTYSFNRKDFLKINQALENLKFKEILPFIKVDKEEERTFNEISKINEYLIMSKLNQLTNVLVNQKDDFISIKKSEITSFIYNDMNSKTSIERKEIFYFINSCMQNEPFLYYYEPEDLTIDDVNYFFKK